MIYWVDYEINVVGYEWYFLKDDRIEYKIENILYV